MLACISVITVSGVFTMTSLAGMFSLGQAAYMSICAYLTFVLARYLDWPIWFTAILGLLASGLLAFIIKSTINCIRHDSKKQTMTFFCKCHHTFNKIFYQVEKSF